MKYKIKYTDNTGCGDSIDEYNTIEEAEAAIEEELNNVKECWQFGKDCGCKFVKNTI